VQIFWIKPVEFIQIYQIILRINGLLHVLRGKGFRDLGRVLVCAQNDVF